MKIGRGRGEARGEGASCPSLADGLAGAARRRLSAVSRSSAHWAGLWPWPRPRPDDFAIDATSPENGARRLAQGVHLLGDSGLERTEAGAQGSGGDVVGGHPAGRGRCGWRDGDEAGAGRGVVKTPLSVLIGDGASPGCRAWPPPERIGCWPECVPLIALAVGLVTKVARLIPWLRPCPGVIRRPASRGWRSGRRRCRRCCAPDNRPWPPGPAR